MDSKWTRRLGLLGLFGLVLWTAVGCAAERQPINQVQANALSKHFFVGPNLSDPTDDPEFYMRNTVIDVPYGAQQDGLFTATYAQPLNRVKWEITETSLVARSTYELVTNSDFHGAKSSNNGQVVAMFNITSHFDIRRSYNPQTGEETNIITENTTDRPWYQREYFRVDWSKNLVTDGYLVDTLSMIGIFGGVKFDPESYFVDDPADPNAPMFVQDEGYFDVTTKAFATPQIITTPFGTFPACFLPAEYGGSGPIANCNPTELTLRLSFKQVGNSDYEPADWDGRRMDAFGWFTQDRYGYTRNYGVLDDNWHRFASRYNIWAKSHVDNTQCAVDYWRDQNGNVQQYQTDGAGNFKFDPGTGLPVPASGTGPNAAPFTGPAVGGASPASNIGLDVHRDADADGTEDACQFTDGNNRVVNPGSRCDEFSNKCTLPLYARSIKTIPWYIGPDSPADLFPSTAVALGQWNLAVKRAAQLGKMVEANRVSVDIGQPGTPDATNPDGTPKLPVEEQDLINDAGKNAPDVFVLCHNPTITGDSPACTPNGKQVYARIGDIRYNSVNILPNPQIPSPWGIMVDADDPLTGEKVATSVNEWGYVLDIAAQNVEDLLRWINGEITDQQIASGQYLHEWVNASKLSSKQYAPSTLSTAEIQSRLNSIAYDRGTPGSAAKASAIRHTSLDQLKQQAIKLQASTLGPSLDAQFEAGRQALIGTPFEVALATPENLQAAGLDPQTPVAGNDSALAQGSLLRGQNPQLNRWIRHMRDLTMAKSASCMIEQPEPDSLVGLARQAAKLYPVPDPSSANYPALKYDRDHKLHQWLREQFHISVIAHEMGHSMGLRHNFTGSYDALNYHPQYWQLRTRNGQEHYCVAPNTPFSKTAALDSTTPHTNGADCVGPRWVDPVTDQEVSGLIWKWASSTVMDYPGDQTQDMNDIGLYDKAAMRFGYADIVDVDKDATLPAAGAPNPAGGDKASDYFYSLDGFGGIVGRFMGGNYPNTNNHYTTYADKYGMLGTCSTQSDPNDPLSATCTGAPLDYVARRDMKTVDGGGLTPGNFSVDSQNRVRHPYMFGSDEFADIGNVPVFRFDAGGDSYEQYQFLISTYENRYIFDNFRRDRSTFQSKTQLHRAEDRYFDKIQAMTKSLALMLGLFQPYAPFLSKQPQDDAGWLMSLAMGSSDGLATFARILTRPEPACPYGSSPFACGYWIQSVSGPLDNPVPFANTSNVAVRNSPNIPDFSNVNFGGGEARYLHNDYDYSQGYYWSDYQIQVGSYYEKERAIYYLMEAYNQFISNSKEDYIDGRYKNLNYSSIYPNQVRRLFAQLMQNDPMTFGPFVNATDIGSTAQAHIQYLPWEKYDANTPSTINLDYSKGAIVLDPLVGWEEQYPALIDAFNFGPTTLTMDFVSQMRIFSPGGGDTISIPANEQVRFLDPLSGVEYVARNYGGETINSAMGTPVMKTSGARMIQFANQLAARTFQITATDPVTGELTYAVDATGNPICNPQVDCGTNTAMLRNYAANLDTARQLAFQFGYGPMGHCAGNPNPTCQ